MNNRKLVLYNSPNNAVQFEFIKKENAGLSSCYLQMACYSGEHINWQNNVSIELSMTMLIEMISILHQLNGQRIYTNLGKNQKKILKFGIGESKNFARALWIELNEDIGNELKLRKPKIAISVAARLGDLITLKAFMIGALSNMLVEETGVSYTVTEIMSDLLNPSAIAKLTKEPT
jgi:hypothetical protein